MIAFSAVFIRLYILFSKVSKVSNIFIAILSFIHSQTLSAGLSSGQWGGIGKRMMFFGSSTFFVEWKAALSIMSILSSLGLCREKSSRYLTNKSLQIPLVVMQRLSRKTSQKPFFVKITVFICPMGFIPLEVMTRFCLVMSPKRDSSWK